MSGRVWQLKSNSPITEQVHCVIRDHWVNSTKGTELEGDKLIVLHEGLELVNLMTGDEMQNAIECLRANNMDAAADAIEKLIEK